MNREITREITINVEITPFELAEVWCSMSGREQAEFFNATGFISNKWSSPLSCQLQSVCNSPSLQQYGERAMSLIGDYAGGANE